MSKIMPKKLQIKNIKNALIREFKAACFDRENHIDFEDIIDEIDFESLIDNQLSYPENLDCLRKYINEKFGYSVIYHSDELESSDFEKELKNFREELRVEFNNEGYDLNSEDFEELLSKCIYIFSPETLIPRSLAGRRESISSTDPESLATIRTIKDSRVREIVEILKRKPQELSTENPEYSSISLL